MGRAKGRRLLSERRAMAEEDKTKDVGFYNPHDGIKGRDGGPYLDHVERIQAEINRANIEEREPDLDTPPATAGTPLVTVGELVDNSTTGNVSQRNRPGLEVALSDDVFTETDGTNEDDEYDERVPRLADPLSVLPVDFGT